MRISFFKKAAGTSFVILAAVLGGFWMGHSCVSHGEPVVLYSLDKRANDQAIIGVIEGAQKYVYFAVYTFTKDNIADALVEAKQKGLDVRGITDAGEAVTAYEKPIVQKLEPSGIPIETQTHEDGLDAHPPRRWLRTTSYAMGSYN